MKTYTTALFGDPLPDGVEIREEKFAYKGTVFIGYRYIHNGLPAGKLMTHRPTIWKVKTDLGLWENP